MERRTKEISIRKVLGSSVLEIITMLIKDFTQWILLANLIAWPISWYIMNRWLQNFAYKIDISWWEFVLPGGIALIIALTTVIFQTIKAATANPVESLRYE
jgi:putative ABC transport system permease protein